MGAGLHMDPGDIAFKSNFATLDEGSGIVTSRRADRRFEDLGPVLCADLDGLPLPSFPQHSISVRYATEHRCGVVVRGPGLSDAITGTDPLKDNLPLQEVRPLDGSPEAAHTAAVVAEVSAVIRQALKGHPVNVQRISEGKNPANLVLLRGCGSRIAVQSFEERHGLRGAMVAPTKIIAGLGASVGLSLLSCPGATGDYRTDFAAKAATVADALISGACDFAFLHVKAVDDTGHDRAAALKVAYLEVVDQMVGQLLRRLADADNSCSSLSSGQAQQVQGASARQSADIRSHGGSSGSAFAVCVTGDHSTPVVFGDHSHEPVPFTLAHVADVVKANGAASLPQLPLPPISHPSAPQKTLVELAAAAERRCAVSGSHLEAPQGNHRSGDTTMSFGESAASAGALGRFPGCEVLPLIKRFLMQY